MSIVMQYVDRLHEILDKHADQRTTNWFMMTSPFPTLFICLCYVYVVKVLGPKLMENRKPFHLKNALIVYNTFQMLFSAWLFYERAAVNVLSIAERNVARIAKRATRKHKRAASGLMNEENDFSESIEHTQPSHRVRNRV